MEVAVVPSPARLSGEDLVRVSQGFSCVFWGLPVALLFAVQLLVLEVVVPDPFLSESLAHLYFFLFCAVLALVCFGTLKLQRVRAFGVRWDRRARVCVSLATVNLYFSPFLYWWRALPENAFYTLNLFGFILSLICFLFSLNCLSMELGRFFGDNSLLAESRLFLGINALVLALPFSGAVVWAAYRGLRADASGGLGEEFLNLFRFHYPWRLTLFIVLFLPISLTLANVWRVKEIVVAELKKG